MVFFLILKFAYLDVSAEGVSTFQKLKLIITKNGGPGGPGTGAFDLAWGGAVRRMSHLCAFGPTHLNTPPPRTRPFQPSLNHWFVLRGHGRSF